MNLSDVQHLSSDRPAVFLRCDRQALLIDGQWASAAASGATFETSKPATEELIAQIAATSNEDVDRAVWAPRKAFGEGPWSRMSPVERQRLILKLADLVEDHGKALAEIASVDIGKSVGIAPRGRPRCPSSPSCVSAWRPTSGCAGWSSRCCPSLDA